MIKRKKKHSPVKHHETPVGLSRRKRAAILTAMIVVGAVAVVLAIVAIIVTPKVNPGAQRGVGATGFQAYAEDNSDLGMAKIVSKENVAAVLGDKAKVISNVDVSKVINVDGNRGQTATYNFVRSDGARANIYIDLMIFKNQTTFDAANVTNNTIKGGTINGLQAYYLHAQTLGSEREYRLMVIKGTNVYKFVFVQPYRNITVSEVAALATLKKLAAKVEF